jgi:hypothetical protein
MPPVAEQKDGIEMYKTTRVSGDVLTLERTALRAFDRHVKIAEVILMRRRRDSRCWIGDKALSFLQRRRAIV